MAWASARSAWEEPSTATRMLWNIASTTISLANIVRQYDSRGHQSRHRPHEPDGLRIGPPASARGAAHQAADQGAGGRAHPHRGGPSVLPQPRPPAHYQPGPAGKAATAHPSPLGQE